MPVAALSLFFVFFEELEKRRFLFSTALWRFFALFALFALFAFLAFFLCILLFLFVSKRALHHVQLERDTCGQCNDLFHQLQGSPQWGGNNTVDEGQQPVANESEEDTLDAEDHNLRGHFVQRANCGEAETPERTKREV